VTAISRVGVVGCGIMGAGIAEICARADLDVRVAVVAERSAERGRRRLAASLGRGVRKGLFTEADRELALKRVSFATKLSDLADRQIVFEAVPENEALKLRVFCELDHSISDRAAILASNTSSIPIHRLAAATGRPERVVGVHFFSPVPSLPLVELIGTSSTEAATLARTEAFVEGVLGKQAIRSQDRPGFVVNVLLIPYLLSAVRMVESGFATPQVIDKGMMLGCGQPVGPLRLVDLIGLDTVASVARALHEEFTEPQYMPPPMLLRMVDDGLLGKKAGRGFYDYT